MAHATSKQISYATALVKQILPINKSDSDAYKASINADRQKYMSIINDVNLTTAMASQLIKVLRECAIMAKVAVDGSDIYSYADSCIKTRESIAAALR